MILIFGLFLIVSVILSMVGSGGGVLYVPVLLAFGYPFAIASSTSLFLITVTGFSAFSRFERSHLVDWQLAVAMETFTDIGAFVGGYTAVHFPPHLLRVAFGMLLLIAAVFVLRMQKAPPETVRMKKGLGYWQREFGEYHYSIFLPVVVPVTFTIGFLSGALGIAGGLLKVPIMILWFSVPAKVAVATSSLMVGFTGLLGFTGHLFTGKIDWLLCASLGIAVLLGGQLGSRISIRLPEKQIDRLLAFVLTGVALWMIIRAF